MKPNRTELKRLNSLIDNNLHRKHIIVLDPEDKEDKDIGVKDNIIYDGGSWNLPETLSAFVESISKNNQMSPEDKTLAIYEKICLDYVYDDNLISYIQKKNDNSFFVPDEYGRKIDENWEKNREEHNRRICYEVSRYLAKSLSVLFKDRPDVNICIFWDKGLTHYFVGLSGREYSVALDLDDFTYIKDLTRIKTDLTAEGIQILEDRHGIFKSAVDKFNEGREKYATVAIEKELEKREKNEEQPEVVYSNDEEENEEMIFIQNAIEVLKEKYEIDSQGMFEYMKEIVDTKMGAQYRKKVWKVMKGEDEQEKRHIRCLVITLKNQKYIIDVDKQILRPFSADEFDMEDPEFLRYQDGTRDWGEPYNGK